MTAQYTILSMMKDEGPWLLEWVAFHRLIGFDNICVYTNDCRDGTDRMLGRLEEMGVVRHFENRVPPGKKPQPNALRLAGKNTAVTETDWLIAMDVDEFMAIKTGNGRIDDLLAACPQETDAVMMTWRVFGSSGLTDWQAGPLTSTFTQSAPDDFRKGWGVKTLFRPFEGMKLGIHRPQIAAPKRHPDRVQRLLDQTWVNGSGKPLPTEAIQSAWRSTEETLGYELVELNHYAVRSREAYLLRQLRGNVNNKVDKYDANYFAIFDRNEVPATTAMRHVDAMKSEVDALLEDSQLRDLHRNSLAYHADALARLKADGTYAARMVDLEAASRVPYDRLDDVLFTGHLPKDWRERIAEMRQQGMSDKDLARFIARGIAAYETRQKRGGR